MSLIACIPAGITTLSVESYTIKFGYLVAKLCWNDHVTADVIWFNLAVDPFTVKVPPFVAIAKPDSGASK